MPRPLKFLAVIVACFLFALGCDDDSDSGVGLDPLPTVEIVSPLNMEAVSDIVEIRAEASDDKGIVLVRFFVDAQLIASDAVPPYTTLWNASLLDHESVHSIYAVAYDTDDNKSGSAIVLCVIDTFLSMPQDPTIYLIDDITESSVRLVWSRDNDLDFNNYSIMYDIRLMGEPSLLATEIFNADDTVYTIHGLRDTTGYNLQILITDAGGKKGASNISRITTRNASPPASTLLGIVKHGDTLRFIWSVVSVWDFLSYELHRSFDAVLDVADLSLVTVMASDSTVYDYPTTDTTKYYYFIVVKDRFEGNSFSTAFFDSGALKRFALDFDGTTYATIPYFAALNVGAIYTLEAWVNQRSVDSYQRVIDKSPEGDPWFQYSLISDQQLGADFCANGSPTRIHATSGVGLVEWHHIALTMDNGTIIYYIDGRPIDTTMASIPSSCGLATTLNIGRRKMFNEFYFYGIIDEVRVWNTVRTSAEILSTYNAHLTGAESGLVCYYDFDEGIGDDIFSPIGGNGHLGGSSGPDSKDPVWVESMAPIVY